MPDEGLMAVDSEPVESPVTDETTSTEVDTESTPVETEGATPEGQTAVKEPAVVDGRLSKTALDTLRELRAKNPALAAEMKRALLENSAYRQQLPGGLKDVQKLRETIETLGGENGIQEVQQELQGWNTIDELYTKGDPKVIEHFTDTPEGAGAFQKLAIPIFEKFADMNPDGHAGYVARCFVADLQSQNIPLTLARLGDFLGDNPKAVEMYNQLAAYFDRIGKFSRLQPSAPKANPEIDQREAKLNEREEMQTRANWRSMETTERTRIFDAAWAKLSTGRQISADKAAAIKELHDLRLSKAMHDPKFNENLERYFKAHDQQGFLRFLTSFYNQQITTKLSAAFDQLLPSKPGPKAANGAPKNGASASNGPAKPAVGFQFVSNMPQKGNVDMLRTSAQMWAEGKAILNDGKRVQWRR